MSNVEAINETLKVLTDELGRIEAERNEILFAKYALERVRSKMVAKDPSLKAKAGR